MDIRLVAAAAALLALGTACAAQPAALGGTTAKVTIDGESTGGPLPVRCAQSGWLWTIKSLDEKQGFTVDLDTGDDVVVQAITFQGVGGFTGSVWRDNIGEAEVESAGGTFTITGSADGSFTDNPSNAVSTTFRIEANC